MPLTSDLSQRRWPQLQLPLLLLLLLTHVEAAISKSFLPSTRRRESAPDVGASEAVLMVVLLVALLVALLMASAQMLLLMASARMLLLALALVLLDADHTGRARTADAC